MNTLNNINAVIFDLGGVILNLDTERTIEAFRNLGAEPENLFKSDDGPDGIFHKFETGKISTEEFLAELLKHLPSGCNAENILEAWNAMLLDLPKDRLEFIRNLSRRMPVYLLSNTNEAHIEAFENKIRSEFKKDVMEEVFLEVYYSCRMGLRKPDPEIFIQLTRQHGLDPRRTLFIDDSESNVKGAGKAGLQTIHLKPGEKVEVVLQRLLN